MWCWRGQNHSMLPHRGVKLGEHIDTNARLQFRNGKRVPVLAVVIGCEVGCGRFARGHVDRLVDVGWNQDAALEALQFRAEK